MTSPSSLYWSSMGRLLLCLAVGPLLSPLAHAADREVIAFVNPLIGTQSSKIGYGGTMPFVFSPVRHDVLIDNGKDTFYANAIGTVNLTSTPLATGNHTLRVAAYSEHDDIAFQGLCSMQELKLWLPLSLRN